MEQWNKNKKKDFRINQGRVYPRKSALKWSTTWANNHKLCAIFWEHHQMH